MLVDGARSGTAWSRRDGTGLVVAHVGGGLSLWALAATAMIAIQEARLWAPVIPRDATHWRMRAGS